MGKDKGVEGCMEFMAQFMGQDGSIDEDMVRDFLNGIDDRDDLANAVLTMLYSQAAILYKEDIDMMKKCEKVLKENARLLKKQGTATGSTGCGRKGRQSDFEARV